MPKKTVRLRIRNAPYKIADRTQSISQQWRVEQIMWAKRAIENALQRRDMTNDYELSVQISAQYMLKRRRKQ
jgi:hypothetical protein